MGREPHRAEPREGDLRFSFAARRRRHAGLRLRLVRRADGAADGNLRRRDSSPARRQTPARLVPEQKITVAEAVRAYTMGSAYAGGDEKVKGSIEVGKLADLVALSADIFKIDPVEIEKTKVVMTIFDGKVVY